MDGYVMGIASVAGVIVGLLVGITWTAKTANIKEMIHSYKELIDINKDLTNSNKRLVKMTEELASDLYKREDQVQAEMKALKELSEQLGAIYLSFAIDK